MSTAGRSNVALVVLLVACSAGIFLLARIARDRAGSPDRPTVVVAPPGASTTAGEHAPEPVRLEPPPASPSRASDAGAAGAPKNRFDGRGTIRGQVVVQGGAAFPDKWTLVVEPSPFLEGRERAGNRRVEFEHGEKEFRVDDLPLAGYLVRVQAAGLNNVPCNVLLVKGSEQQYVMTALLPSGFVDGSVLDHLGRPAAGLDVTLESQATKERRTISTDPAGAFLFRDVLDGEYTLCFGRPDSPLLPPDSLAFKAPSMRFPTRTLPPTARLKIVACDPANRGIPRTVIHGYAAPGGAIDSATDDLGKADVRYLPPGHYKIEGTAEDGRRGDVTVDLKPGDETDVALVMRP